MIFWIRLKNFSDNKKRYIRIEEKWQNYFYIASDNVSKLEQLVQNDNILSSISSYEFVKRYETIIDTKNSIVLKLSMYGKNLKLANTIEKMNGYQDCRLYNVDLIPEQKYFFDHDIFPLGLFEVTDDNSVLLWEAKNDGISLPIIIYHILKRYISSLTFQKVKL